MTTVTKIVNALRAAGCDPVQKADGSWGSFCPAHENSRSHRNLYVTEGDAGAAVLYCHACGRGGTAAIVAAIGLTMTDLFPETDRPAKPAKPAQPVKLKKQPKIYKNLRDAINAARFSSRDEAGADCQKTGEWQYPRSSLGWTWWVIRFDGHRGKAYRPIHQCGPNDFRLGDPQKSSLPLYGANRILESVVAQEIYVVEGEKCADALHFLGMDAVSPSHGAQSPHKSDWTPLGGRVVVIWPDNDDPGKKFADAVADILAAMPSPPRLVSMLDPALLGLGQKDDAADFVAARAGLSSADIRSQFDALTNGLLAIRCMTPVATPPRLVPVELALDPRGQPFANMCNVCRIIQPQNIWYNEFSDQVFADSNPWSDAATLALTNQIQADQIPRIRKEVVFDAVMHSARSRTRNPPREYLASLKWDGVERISRTWPTYFGATDTPYSQAIGRNFWISLIARVQRPGCQLDNMVVLEGDQGAGKSQALRAIGGEWFAEVSESVNSKDFFISLRGVWLAEIAELDSFSRAEVTCIKRAITCQVDRYRSPYDRCASDHPRRTAFAGSTNNDQWIRDPTGGRRFWPIKIGKIDLTAIKRDRDQMFAEAMVAFGRGEAWHLSPAEETLEEQASRQVEEVWLPRVLDWLTGRWGEITTGEVLADALKIEPARQDRAAQMRAATCLRAAGWTSHVVKKTGQSCRVWRREPPPKPSGYDPEPAF